MLIRCNEITMNNILKTYCRLYLAEDMEIICLLDSYELISIDPKNKNSRSLGGAAFIIGFPGFPFASSRVAAQVLVRINSFFCSAIFCKIVKRSIPFSHKNIMFPMLNDDSAAQLKKDPAFHASSSKGLHN